MGVKIKESYELESSEPMNFEQLTFDAELAEIKPYYIVNQSNDLINSQQDLTLTERRIIFSLISLVQPEDKEMKTYILPVRDLAELIGISEKSFYDRVEKAVDSLQSKVLIIEKMDSQGNLVLVDKINWIQQATYLKRKGLVRIKLSDGLAQYLLDLKSFTKYHLYNVLQLKSEYSWRIYELLKEKEPLQQKRIIRYSELRRLLNIPDDKLTDFRNFKRIVLNKAQEELKEKTDIYFEYETYKKYGRKVDSLIFYIYKNEENIRKLQTREAVDFDVRNLLNRLIKYGVNRSVSADLIRKYHPRYIEENLAYALKMTQGDSNIENISGYIVKAIQHNYADSAYEYVENAYESTLYSIAASDYVQKLKERTEEDIAHIKELIKHYEKAILRAGNDPEEIRILVKQRKEQLYLLFDKIHEFRQKHRFPFLTENDFKDEKTLLSYFKDWKKRRGLQFSLSYNPDDEVEDIQMIGSEDIPY